MLLDAISPIKRLKGEKGQDIVEFALVFPILAALLFGIIDFGWIFYSTAMVANATREGARFAVMNYKTADTSKPAGKSTLEYLDDEVTINVEASLPAYLKNTYADLKVDVTEDPAATGGPKISVAVESNIKLFTPTVSTIIGGSKWTIRKKVSMKKID